MTNATNVKYDIDAIEARIDELSERYRGAWRGHNDAVSVLPADATLRDMDARRGKAAELTRDASKAQEGIAGDLIEAAADALAWANGVLDSGDYSDGLDGMDRDALARVFDRAVIRGDKPRALAAATLLDADGDTTALPRLSANYPNDIGAALSYRDEWRDEPSAVLAPLRSVAMRMPDDERIRPSIEVARRHAAEDAERRAAEEAAELERRRELHAELNRTTTGGVARSVESRQRVKRTPVPGGGLRGRGALGQRSA